MKKRVLSVLVTILTICVLAFTLTACDLSSKQPGVTGGNLPSTPTHTHTYDRQVAEEKYLASEASCTAKATYYYFCECGEKGETTFEYGEPKAHNYTSLKYDTENHWYECICGAKNDEAKHTFIGGKCSICQYEHPISEGLVFELNWGGESYCLTGIGTCTDTDIVIPTTYNDKPVTSIGEDVFHGCSSLTSIVIPDSVTRIGLSGYGVFRSCASLTSIEVDENNAAYSSIDGNLYSKDGTELIQYAIGKTATEFIIPDSVTNIGERAFYDCNNLTSITISNSVTSIGDYVFVYCSSLTSVTIGNSVTSIGCSTFESCYSLQYNEYDNAKYLGNKDNPYLWLIKASSRDITSCTVNENCKFIYEYAFSSCKNLTSITIPDSVTSIGEEAFYNCDSLTSVTIGNSVTSIGDYAFSNCRSLTSVTIGNSVTSIGDYAFFNCRSLTSVTLGNGVTSIGDYAFYDCDSLTSITIPYGVTDIGEEAFSGCSSLTSIVIPDSVTSIGDYAFYGCYKLVEVINKSNLSITKGSYDNGYVGYYALNVKTSGKSEIKNINDYLFYTYNSVNYLIGYVGKETELVLPKDYNGKSYEIYRYAFYECSSLTSIVIPDTVTSIGRSAFGWCYNLTAVYYNGTAKQWRKISIGEYNSDLTNATRYYYSESQPTENGNYWHYVDGEPKVW